MKKRILYSLLTFVVVILMFSCTKETVTPDNNNPNTNPVVTTPPVDKEAPIISMLSPADNGTLDYQKAIVISGTVSDKNLQSIVIRITNDADSKELFSKPMAIAGVESAAINESFTPNDLFEGSNLTISIVAKDSKGNEAKKEIKVKTKGDPVIGKYIGTAIQDITDAAQPNKNEHYVWNNYDMSIKRISTNRYQIDWYYFSISGNTMVFEPNSNNDKVSGTIINGKINYTRIKETVSTTPPFVWTIKSTIQFTGQKQ